MWINWLFSFGIGLWQGLVHHAGPSTKCADDQEYFLCGAEQGVAQSYFVPLTGKDKEYRHFEVLLLIRSNSFACSDVHLHPPGGDHLYQLLHLHEADLAGETPRHAGVCKL